MNMNLIKILCCASLIGAATSASAGTMNVATFLAKSEALMAKGMMAMFSSDLSVLKSEIASASAAYRARPVSRAPISCPPPKGQAKMSSDELLGAFRKIPAEQRNTMSVDDAFAKFMIQRFPCK